jgi:DNA polymerase-3 subunit epsilon
MMSSNNTIPQRAICLDIETTGLKPDVDRIVQLACVELIDGCIFGTRANWIFNPGIPIPEDSTKVHGLRDKDVQGKPSFTDKVQEFLSLIGDSPLIIHNAEFDIAFLNAELKRAGHALLENPLIDTLPMVRARVGTGRANLNAACKLFRIPLGRRKHRHDALIDAELLAEVYGHLVGARNKTLFDLSALEANRTKPAKKHEPDTAGDQTAGHDRRTSPVLIPDRGLGGPSEAELKAHRIWRQGFGLSSLCLILALGACSVTQVPQEPPQGVPGPVSDQTVPRVSIVDEVKTITAEDRVLVDQRQDTNRKVDAAQAYSVAQSNRQERSAQPQRSEPNQVIPPTQRQDIVDARTLAILEALLGPQPPPPPTIGSQDGVPTGTSPMLRLIQP